MNEMMEAFGYKNPDNHITIIVTGGRNYSDERKAELVAEATVEWRDHHHPDKALILTHGCASGADTLMSSAVIQRWDYTRSYRADWDKHGKAAGPIRNQQMIDAGAYAVFAFPGGRGTKDCMSRAEAAGIPVLRISEWTEGPEVQAFLSRVHLAKGGGEKGEAE